MMFKQVIPVGHTNGAIKIHSNVFICIVYFVYMYLYAKVSVWMPAKDE